MDGYIGVDCYYLCVLLRTIILRDDASTPEISVAKSARFNELGNIILLVIYCCTLNAKVGSAIQYTQPFARPVTVILRLICSFD